jgi:4-hydroxybenzoate polyprenyltransferase
MYNFRQRGIYLHTGDLRELAEFMRLKIVFFITGIAVSGYLYFNPLGIKLAYVALCSFFGVAAVYSFNLITDKEEDLINEGKINRFVLEEWKGVLLVVLFVMLGMLFSLRLSLASTTIYLISLFIGIFYSISRIKNMFPLKNLYTGLALPTVFLIGAFAGSTVSLTAFVYYLLLSVNIFTISLLSDLRDFKGDKETGLRTLPVVLGQRVARRIVYLALLLFSAAILVFRFEGLYVLLPFSALVLLDTVMGQYRTAHLYIMVSYMCLPFYLGALKWI